MKLEMCGCVVEITSNRVACVDLRVRDKRHHAGSGQLVLRDLTGGCGERVRCRDVENETGSHREIAAKKILQVKD